MTSAYGEREMLIECLMSAQFGHGWLSRFQVMGFDGRSIDTKIPATWLTIEPEFWRRFDELRAMPLAKLEAEYEPIKRRSEADEHARKEAQRQRDWELCCRNWARKDYWTVDELVSLVEQRDPEQGGWYEPDLSFLDTLTRALSSGAFGDRALMRLGTWQVQPGAAIEWCERKKFSIPSDLRSAVEEFHQLTPSSLAPAQQTQAAYESVQRAFLTVRRAAERCISEEDEDGNAQTDAEEVSLKNPTGRAALIRLLADAWEFPKVVSEADKSRIRGFLLDHANGDPFRFTGPTFDKAWKLAKDRVRCQNPADKGPDE